MTTSDSHPSKLRVLLFLFVGFVNTLIGIASWHEGRTTKGPFMLISGMVALWIAIDELRRFRTTG